MISYDGNTGNALANASTSGVSTDQDVANNQEQALGYVAGLAGGSSTISMTDSGGSSELHPRGSRLRASHWHGHLSAGWFDKCDDRQRRDRFRAICGY